ncbi:MAG: Rpn family recombination-promoting nuclease/putative transposase [Salinivirgaceae bacterium]|nr:Rpn family recombination-promoting nuclease/putative transposase [Salinivirgaceae bacterium]
MSKYLDPKADLTFKKVFGQHKNLVQSLLNALLPLPDGMEIKSVEYLTPENIPDNPAKKYSIVDVRCTDNYGRHFIVEMQSFWTQEFFSRTVFNAAAAYSGQLGRGISFAELKDVYALSLVNEESFCFSDDGDCIQEYYLMNKRHTEDIRTNISLIFVELPKFNPTNKGDKAMKKLWLKFLTEINENTIDAAPELLENKEISQALEIVRSSAYTPGELAAYQKYLLDTSIEKSAFEGERRRGREEGRAEGREEEKLEIARNLKKAGIDIKIIVQSTGLTTDEIAKL